MADDGVVEAARAVRPRLAELVGPTAGDVDAELAGLLAAAAEGEDVTVRLRTVLDRHEGTSVFLERVLADPEHRPPGLSVSRGDYNGLPGKPIPTTQADKYTCPHGDFVWYRQEVGLQPPYCPTHDCQLKLV